jgi:hypothetical protein
MPPVPYVGVDRGDRTHHRSPRRNQTSLRALSMKAAVSARGSRTPTRPRDHGALQGRLYEWAREKAGVASASQYALDDFGHEPEYSAQIEEAWIAH